MKLLNDSKMNTTIKTALISMLCFIVAFIIVLPFTIYHVIDNQDEEIERYQNEEIRRVEQSLKDYVEIAYAMIDTHYQNAVDKGYLEKYYGHRLASVLEMAESLLNSKAEAIKNGELTLEQAQEQAAAEIKKFRYDGGAGYVWITDIPKMPNDYPKMIMHPLAPALDGQELTDSKHNRPIGKNREPRNLYQAAVEICQQHGKCVVDYLEDKTLKDGVVIEDVLKLAYVKLFPDWNWALGTAVYVDEAVIDAMEKSQNDLRKLGYDNGMGYFWISSADKSNLKLIVHPKEPSLEGLPLEGDLKNLYESLVDTCEKQNGSGFYTNTIGGVKKKFYVKSHKQLGWIVGTGVLDNLEKTVLNKRERVSQKSKELIFKLVTISIVVVLLISVFSYILSQYIPYAKAIIKQQAASKTGTDTAAMNGQTPGLAPDQTQKKAMLPTDDCIKMIQEISKTLIAEQSKLLATAIPKAAQMARAAQTTTASEVVQGYEAPVTAGSEVPDEVKQLANKTYQTIEEVKKRVGAGTQQQQASEPVNTVEIAKFNTVMGNLNKMVGDKSKKV